MENPFSRWFKVIGIALSVALLPMAVSEYILYNFALSSGTQDVRFVADTYLRRSEAAMAEAIRALGHLKAANHTTCESDSLQAFIDETLKSVTVQEIGLVDSAGIIMCGAPSSSEMKPLRLPAASEADPVVTIGVVARTEDEFGRVVVTLRVGRNVRLLARLRPNALDIAAGSSYLSDQNRVQIFLSDGSEWPMPGSSWRPGSSRLVVTQSAISMDFPIHVQVSASGEAMQEFIAPLRFISLATCFLAGIAAFSAAIWVIWTRDYDVDEFSRAVRNREFVPYYQPVMDITNGKLRGCEMLVRWIKPDGTMISPGAFLPYAEATGLIREITIQLMEQTVIDLADLYQRLPGLKVSINLTASHFVDSEIIKHIVATYGDTGIEFHQLMFEVTEQHPLKDIVIARRVIRQIQELGAAVALDDVGTGHGGLAYVQKLGVDILKIDKMFVDGLGRELQAEKIVVSLIDLANNLGMGVIAEGVEDQQQLQQLRRLGVTVAQGYVFAPPMPIAAFRDLILSGCADELRDRDEADAVAEAAANPAAALGDEVA